MKILIVYDSVFGNTEKVAQAMGQALEAQAEVQVLRVTAVSAEHLSGLDVLIVGSPTRAFSPTPAIKNWLKGLPSAGLSDVRIAAFDTRIALSDANSRILSFFVKIFGYAAEPIRDKLVKKGGTQAIAPEGFYVQASEGPMKDGELERSAAWAGQIAPS